MYFYFFLQIVSAEDVTVNLAFQVQNPTSIFYGLPFSVVVQANTQNREFSGYDLSISSASEKVTFGGASITQSNLYAADGLGFSGLKLSNKAYRLKAVAKTSASHKTDSLQAIFTLNNLKIVGKDNTDKLVLLTTKDETTGIGVPAFTPGAAEPEDLKLIVHTPIESAVITPKISRCDDGWIAYVDGGGDASKEDGLYTKGSNGDYNEVCEQGRTFLHDGVTLDNNPDNEACLDNCGKIKPGYVPDGCTFNDLTPIDKNKCKLVPVTPKEILIARLMAIVTGTCAYGKYYDKIDSNDICKTNPDAEYAVCSDGSNTCASNQLVGRTSYQTDKLPKINLNKKIEMVSLIAQALNNYFNDPLVIE